MSLQADHLALDRGKSASADRVGVSRSLLALSLRAHDVYLWAVGLYALSALAVVLFNPAANTSGLIELCAVTVASLTFLTLISVCILRFAHIAIHVKPTRPTIALLQEIWRFFSNPARLANGVPVFIATFVLTIVYAFYKANIPHLYPFAWDQTFAELDRAVHFGTDPWRLLQPLLGFALVTAIINLLYNLWFIVMWMSWVVFGFRDSSDFPRTRFLVAFVLLWIVGGSILATVFSSAGPAFFGKLGLAPDPYRDLMTYLYKVNEAIPVLALNLQKLLWVGYEGQIDVALGISAMPSLHNATMLLFSLAAFQINRRMGLALAAFTVLIFIGSIHLGWHYALDAYAGYAVTLVVWWLSGKIANWHESREVSRAYARALADHRSRPDTASGRN